MKIIPKCIKTKRHLCASGSILLPLAQKWGLVGVIVCGLSLFGTRNVSAASITLTTPQSLVINVTPTADGKFVKSNLGSFSVTSDAYAGYTLKISGNDDNALKGENGELPSIAKTDGITEDVFNTAAYNNKWGYKPSKFKSNINDSFLPGPKLSGDIIDETKNADIETNNYTVELGARIDNNQAAGTYKGTFVISVVANDVPYNITYDSNGGATTPEVQHGTSAEGTAVTLASAPTKANYVFLGWCDKATTGEDCTDGNEYKAGGSYILSNGANNIKFYAMWAAVPTTMQNFTPGYCRYMAEGTTITLPDIRDKNEYRIRKLKDGKCWMIDNLRLGDAKLAERTLNSNNTDLNGDISSWRLVDSVKQFSGSVTYATPPQINTDNMYETVSGAGGEQRYIGAYYNWYAATAGSGTFDMGQDNVASSSICPKNWRLPTGGPNSDFQLLVDAYGGAGLTESKPLIEDITGPELLLSGYYWGSSIYYKNSIGAYLSSTANSKPYIYHLLLSNSNGVSMFGDYSGKYDGHSVRCIARE